MNNLLFFLTFFTIVLTFSCSGKIISKRQAPNFLIILVDDLGYGDLGCYGNETIRTPSINKLASQGIRLTDCYSSSPMCSPSRAGLLTGRAPYRTGVYDWIAPDSTMYLPKTEITIATLVKEAGYATCHVGKWHLNGKFNTPEQPQPGDHGFDYWFGIQFNVPHLDPKGFVRNGTPAETKGYACQIVAEESISWLQNEWDQSTPFFQYVCFLEPHEPIMSPPELVEEYGDHGIKADYYANVSNLDQAIGRILKTLDDMELTDNTFVFFTSDNGPAQYTPNGYFDKSHGSAGPLRGFKRHMFEGGIRVPGIIRWPRSIGAGDVSDEPVSNVDLLPTICKIVGIDIPQDRAVDGSDFSPIFEGRPVPRDVPLHWQFYDPREGPQSLIRKGKWMLGADWDVGDFHKSGRFDPVKEIPIIRDSQLQNFELYDLQTDIHQDTDVKNQNPGVLNEMRTELKMLHSQVVGEAPQILP